MKIIVHKQFKKQYKKLSPKAKAQVKARLALFKLEKYHPSLRLHPLKGKYGGYHSLDVAGDIRIIIRLNSTSAVLINIGSHAQLY